MKLIENWPDVVKKAWSLKWTAAAFVTGCAEVGVQYWQPQGMPPGVFAAVAVVLTALSALFRLLKQTELSDGKP
jgi:hypothetical protein